MKVVSSGPTEAAILVEGVSGKTTSNLPPSPEFRQADSDRLRATATAAGGATESWSLALAAGARNLVLNTTGTMATAAVAVR